MFYIKVGDYWLGRHKPDTALHSILSVEKYVLTNHEESGVTLYFKDSEKAKLVLDDYLMTEPEREWNSKIIYKPEIPFE